MLLILALFTHPVLADETLLVLASQPGDYIGQGQQRTITTTDADFRTSRNFDSGVSFQIDDFGRPNPTYTFWYVDLSAPFDATLTVGAYEGATRWPFQAADEPGLSVSGDGRGCNQLTGRFVVLEAAYDPQTGAVSHFAADFEQHCEFPEAPALVGAIRYDSDVPITLQLPPTIQINTPLNHQHCAEATGPEGANVSLTAIQHASGSYAFNWTTSTGLSGSGRDFVVPVGLDVPVLVTLTQTDLTTSTTVTVTQSLCASDTTPPQVEILAPAEGRIFTGRSIPLAVRVTDVVDKAISQYTVFAGYESTVELKGEIGRAQLPPTKTNQGGTELMLRVEAQDAHGNVGLAYRWVTVAHDARQ